MKTQDIKQLYEHYVLPTYTQANLCLVKGKGAQVWDLEGKEYLDLFPGWAVSGLGHCPPEVVNAIKDQCRKIMHVPNNFYNPKQGQLAREIVDASFEGKVFFCNSGAEATDGALKFARKFGDPQGRFEVITMSGSFHGRTFGGISATAQEKVRKGFGPMLEGFRYAEFNNLVSVASQVNDKTIAIFLEPIQGEGGVNVASQEFMKGLRKLCDEKKLLLMVDEVQTGMGRTGRMFAYQHYNIEPDVMTLAKSLGGGFPIGAFVVNQKVAGDVFSPGSHGSTFGGNPLAAAAALAVFRTIHKKKLLERTVELGEYFGKKLHAMKEKYAVIDDVRGVGLMRGLGLKEPGAPIVEACLQTGLLINCTQGNILRIFPTMTMSRAQLDRGLKILGDVLEKMPAGVA